ncbi:hypothetical protein GCM10023194_68050 [Planotetraspora phitsanulokensis]|uniref:Uncharacterized protein n=1 Tax=Planotetraspora phitsanulokensis TaxID=575192 RepID=A0A8J3U7P5_9ACTN|nr:hypothetical protein [Planotetraspora phitsanulokensis]GII39632.1 hypothetical protein Pph01_46350 [Planotetraspora phitsanulokensis]
MARSLQIGLIAGLSVGGVEAFFVMIAAILGAPYALTWNSLAVGAVMAMFAGLSMTAIGYLERMRQRHYGHYPYDVGNRPADTA